MTERVMVIFGGVSTEHEISCRSAYYIIGALREAGYEVCPVGITLQGEWISFHCKDEVLLSEDWVIQAKAALVESGSERIPRSVSSVRHFLASFCDNQLPDLIFPAVHGINCEDGALQGLLQLSDIPYVGSPVRASAVAMDKVSCKVIAVAAGVPQVPFLAFDRQDIAVRLEDIIAEIETQLGYPCFLKPSNGGSSVGTCSARQREELISALNEVAQYDEVVLVETFIDGRELEVAVLGNRELEVAPVGEIIKAEDVEYYDYETKYLSDSGASVRIPADIPENLQAELQSYAMRIYRACGCAGLSRVDFFWDRRDGKVYFNEINTLPGFTPISLYPQAFAKVGYTLPGLVKRLCDLAVEKHFEQRRRTSRS
ncbi:MAG: D-alanine--D-alanine ligase family protein [Fastidiosipilaceae bacterium]|jgi:D-alanine-D-alanine ligase|nr:D-alanine--D-alanine ligase [Clostridiaceae bacterium]